MKVKNINVSSKRTDEAIRDAFVQLLNEKKELQYISVTELVKRAGITRSSFYTHYENIYDVAKCFEDETMDLLLKDIKDLESLEDAYNYIDTIISYLKENEEKYRMLISTDETMLFFERIRKPSVDRIYDMLVKNGKNSPTLKIDVEFLVDGIFLQFVLYFRNNNTDYSLEILSSCIKNWINKLFFL